MIRKLHCAGPSLSQFRVIVSDDELWNSLDSTGEQALFLTAIAYLSGIAVSFLSHMLANENDDWLGKLQT